MRIPRTIINAVMVSFLGALLLASFARCTDEQLVRDRTTQSGEGADGGSERGDGGSGDEEDDTCGDQIPGDDGGSDCTVTLQAPNHAKPETRSSPARRQGRPKLALRPRNGRQSLPRRNHDDSIAATAKCSVSRMRAGGERSLYRANRSAPLWLAPGALRW